MRPFKRKCCGGAQDTVKKPDDYSMTIAFLGNPNCGKTTLFNAYTGANLKVANWPGVTVEKVEGAYKFKDEKIRLVDLPGIYSLTSYTMEETVSRNFILSGDADVVINVVDASCLERGLYLTLQLLELGKPVVIALNMMDIVLKRGMEIDLHRLPEMLGVPVIPVSARKRTGLDILIHAAVHHKDATGPDRLIHEHKDVSRHAHDHHSEYTMVYSDDIEDMIDETEAALLNKYPQIENVRWHAIKTLERDGEVTGKYPLERAETPADVESEIINQKYSFIGEVIDEVMVHKQRSDALTDKLDRAFTHRIWGIPIFLGIMAAVFFLTFFIGDLIKSLLELGIGALSDATAKGLASANASEIVVSLLVDGIIGGVGTIITFLPNIFILFLALAFLEDSGYMARVAYVMEGVMSRLGLSGKAFIPMLLGFGCTVPAIMASRALESKRDRFKVMLVTPFMSCSARLTIYILFAEMFFAGYAFLAAFSMYLLGILVAIAVSAVLHLIDRKKEVNYLLIELPEYKLPDARTVGIYVWEKVKDYLLKAGTTIFIATLIIWALMYFGPDGFVGEGSDKSFAAIIGGPLSVAFVPIGLGFWEIVVALIAGISAKEVVVSSCAVLFGIADASANTAGFAAALEGIGFGPLNAVCLMVFCLLYIPCTATLATIRKESKSVAWTAFAAFFQLAVAYVITLIVYQIGLLIV